MTTQSSDSDARWPENTVLVGSALALALVVYGGLRFPASIANAGTPPFVIATALLAVYGTAALCSRRSSSADVRSAVRIGAATGVAIAGLAVVNHAVELWTTLPESLGAALGAGMWGVMFLGFGSACSVTLARQHPLAAGLLSSAWCAMMMAILLVVFALGVGFAFMPHMESVLATPNGASGMADTRAFIARHLVSSASSHLFIAPVVAVFVGTLSAVAFNLLARLERRIATLVACATFLLLVGGSASLRHASSLERSHRPPFIGFGLGSLAIALVSVHPLVVALQRSKRRSRPYAPTP